MTEEIAVADFRRGPFIGSDHFPLLARLSLDPQSAKRGNRLVNPLAEEMREQLSDTVAEYAKGLEKRVKPGDSE
ncbi:hypothetical protein N4R57_09320 [Rhodobacteraceae bacterium D3-12]|nr:hypothetical protein N4R57_09320 [Rhodobacteraceae bacterium D3-12]